MPPLKCLLGARLAALLGPGQVYFKHTFQMLLTVQHAPLSVCVCVLCVFAVCHVCVEIVPAAGGPHLAGLGSALSRNWPPVRLEWTVEPLTSSGRNGSKVRHSDSQWAQAANGGTFLLVISASLYRHS